MAGRGMLSAPFVRNDCTIRAVALVTGVPWSNVVARLGQDGYRPGRGFNLDRWLMCQCAPAIGEPEYVFGWSAEWVKVPKVGKGERRWTMGEFLEAHPVGRFIVRQSYHVVAVIDGEVVMEERRDGAPVYGAWRFSPCHKS